MLSTELLLRDFYFGPLKELDLRQGQALKLIKPLCGLSESGDDWRRTFQNHLEEELGMKSCIFDAACF